MCVERFSGALLVTDVNKRAVENVRTRRRQWNVHTLTYYAPWKKFVFNFM